MNKLYLEQVTLKQLTTDDISYWKRPCIKDEYDVINISFRYQKDFNVTINSQIKRKTIPETLSNSADISFTAIF